MRVKDPATAAVPHEQAALVFDKTAQTDRVAHVTVIAFACFVALLVLAAAFFTDRNGDVDELMMYNPSYMLAHFGKLTFPTYSYRTFYDKPVVIHPPIHTAWIGLLQRAGFTWYYAAPVPAVILLLLGIAAVVAGAFPAPVKLGLLFSLGFVVSTGEAFFAPFGVRPEGEVLAAWFAGLILLEAGRLADWNRPKLFAGALLLTYASGVHYYACAALAGVAVYIVWAARDLGWPKAEAPIAALIGGGCLFGVPYVVLFLRPYLKEVLTYVQMTTGDAGVMTSIRIHFQLYRQWAGSDYFPALIRLAVSFGIPLVVFSTIVLSVVKSTRGIALAALPLQIFVLLFAAHKLSNYLVHEIAMFAAALAVGVLAFGDWAWRRIPVPRLRPAFSPLAAACLAVYLAWSHATSWGASIRPFAHVHEAEFARAASRQILGPHATVTGRDGGWFTSGADSWYDIERDMLQASHYDAASFFSNFDAAVDYPHQSETTSDPASGTTISAAYAQGILKLRGFYFGATNGQLQFVLLSARPARQVVGYAASAGRMYRFDEQEPGDYQVLSAVCPITPELARSRWVNRWPQSFSAVTYLPRPIFGGTAIATVLSRRDLAQPAGWMRSACHEIGLVHGTLTPIDKAQLLDKFRRDDTVMQFPRTLSEMPGYRGVVLPENMQPPRASSRLDGAVDLDGIHAISNRAKVERLPGIRITTLPPAGGMSVSIPVTPGSGGSSPRWVQLRLKVLSGEIEFAAFGLQGVVAQTPLPIIKSEQAEDVAIKVSSLSGVNQIVIFNASHLLGAQADVLDASVLAPPASHASVNR